LALFLLVGLAGSAFAQTGNASLGGSVQDPTKALIPGVTITVTNTATNVTVSQLTNESGGYSFPVLQPGTYRVTAELSGFKKTVHENIQLGYAASVRDDFTLEVGAATQTVDIVSTGDSALKETSSSVGTVLNQQAIENLPMVGNNVLSLLDTLPGLRFSPFGDAFDTINGIAMDSMNATRDGMSIIDTRYDVQSYGRNVLSSTTLLPDLVGEIRLIVSPVDAELGRGNSQIQISTRSGTNRYNGSASWNVRNSALDANTWANNHAASNGKNFTPLAWRNNNQYTIAYGGPIQIPGLYNGKGKTFFYTLWDQNISNTRDPSTTATVLTDTARMGIYRYFTGYNPTGWNATSLTNQAYPITAATTASAIAVDLSGNPILPGTTNGAARDPNGNPYSGHLVCLSVFGNQRLEMDSNRNLTGKMVPFSQADCNYFSGTPYAGQAVLGPSTGSGIWDPMRTSVDSTGYIVKFLNAMPHANNFGAQDGLNLASYQYTRGRNGNNSIGAEVGTDAYVNQKQINIKIDHNFTPKHKAAVSYSYQRDNSATNAPDWPNGIFGNIGRTPYVLTVNFTSTLSSRMINEARFGVNHNYDLTLPAYLSQDPVVKKAAQQWLVTGGQSTLNPKFGNYPAVLNPSVNGNFGLGFVGGGTFGDSAGPVSTTGAIDVQAQNPFWNYADTLSWSKGKHAFKFGVEVRLPRTAGNGSQMPLPTVSMGNNSGSTATQSPFQSLTFANDVLPGLNGAPLTSGFTTIAQNSRANVGGLLYFLSGSVSSASQPYWVTSSKNVTGGLWSDYSTSGERLRNQIDKELSIFIKDDYKVTRRLTLNLGVRWEYRASPYIDGGFTSAVIGYGYGAFGATRLAQASLAQFQKDPFRYWLRPGNLYLNNYGSSSLTCQNGVALQNAFGQPIVSMGQALTSTCDPNNVLGIQFVGPDSPNPNVTAEPVNSHDIGPAVGFAYSLPWFGEGKTTIRAGFQQTFGVAGRNGSSLGGTESEIANSLGSTGNSTTVISDNVFANTLSTRALNLSDIQNFVPVKPQTVPGGSALIYQHYTAVSPVVYDPKFHTPYVENINFSVTRQVNRQLTVDLRYVGTMGRKTQGSLNINTNNVYHNPELLQALNDARRGGCDPNAYPTYTAVGVSPCDPAGDPVILDQIMAGLNILATGTSGTDNNGVSRPFGFVGTMSGTGSNALFQSGAMQLRKSGTFAANLANGDFNAVAGSLVGLVPTTAQGRVGPNTDATGVGILATGLRNGCDRLALGYTAVNQSTPGGPTIPGTGAAIPLRCFPEDWLTTNPQFSTITYNANLGHSNYHSMQATITARPTNGISSQFSWIWARSMYLDPTGANYVDPANRNLNFTAQNINTHSFRMNGTFELPIGPNKLFFGNASGWAARALERWQTSVIFNAATGTPSSLSPGQSHCYAAGTSAFGLGCMFDVASPNWHQPRPHLGWYGNSGNVYALPGSSAAGIITPFVGAPDPSCSNPAIITQADKMGSSLGVAHTNPTTGANVAAVCGIVGLFARNPDGTPGENLLRYGGEGVQGNLGRTNIMGLGQWSLDANASKTFRVAESKTFQIRIDAANVLNHPTPNGGSLNAGGPLGFTNTKSTNARTFQGQLRVSF
jgi:hypothetical protein